MAGNRFTKDPNAILDYTWDWSAWLGTDKIDTSTITVSSPDITVSNKTQSENLVTIWLSGGIGGGTFYAVTCKIVTVEGRTDERVIGIIVDHK
jgi:hypothetical protein